MKSNESIKQFMIYIIVGGLATIVEWVMFYVFNNIAGIQYLWATTLAFIVSTYANWAFGKLLLFKEKSKNLIKELLQIYATSIAGLLMNLLIMWIAVDRIGMNEMLSKVIATGIVFFWNFFVRKKLIYKI